MVVFEAKQGSVGRAKPLVCCIAVKEPVRGEKICAPQDACVRMWVWHRKPHHRAVMRGKASCPHGTCANAARISLRLVRKEDLPRQGNKSFTDGVSISFQLWSSESCTHRLGYHIAQAHDVLCALCGESCKLRLRMVRLGHRLAGMAPISAAAVSHASGVVLVPAG